MTHTNDLEKRLKCIWRTIAEEDIATEREPKTAENLRCYDCNGLKMGCIAYVPTKHYITDTEMQGDIL